MITFITEILDIIHHLCLKSHIPKFGGWIYLTLHMEWLRTEPTVMGPLRKRFFPFLVHPKTSHIHPPNCSDFLLTQDNRKCPTFEP